MRRKIPRNLDVLTMVGRKTGPFKDQRKGRGGAHNEQQEYLNEYVAECNQAAQEDNEDPWWDNMRPWDR